MGANDKCGCGCPCGDQCPCADKTKCGSGRCGAGGGGAPCGPCHGGGGPMHHMMERFRRRFPRAQVTKPAPDFTAQAVMPNGEFKEVKLSEFRGKYVLLYFWPLDFTFVCPSEIVAFNKALPELTKRNVQVLGCSTDSHFTHLAWKNTPLEKGGIGNVQHPLVADLTKEISASYGVLLEDQGIALRGLFLIDKEGVLRHSLINDLPLGRSVDEAIRVIDALQFTEEHGEVCPANWKPGQKAMKASAEGVAEYLKGQQ